MGSDDSAAENIGRDNVPRQHFTTTEDGIREFHCLREQETVAVWEPNAQDVDYCPSCGVPYEPAGPVARLERRFPSLVLAGGVFLASLAIYGASQAIPVRYGSEVVATGEFTPAGIALVFFVSVGLASLATWVSRFVGGQVNGE